ncbi:MAG TPA: hypothetical protein VJU79_07340, partial [Candidatus Dormibacteraeota bacterium]|nr:hypothetical protein [Candidatus Dormibacteraeota bacterium]
SLRQDPRVVNLENTNVSRLDGALITDVVELVTVDVSYLALAAAVSQLGRLRIAPDADLLGLVKPMFELRLPRAPTDLQTAERAAAAASAGVASCGWRVRQVLPSPVTGARGAVEMLLHASRV